MCKLLFSFITVLLITTSSFATSILPKNLISLDSNRGSRLFNQSYAPHYFWPLGLNFVTQDNLSYCSIASSVMVLNALHVSGPPDLAYQPYKIFTQKNFFTKMVEISLPAKLVKKQGVTLAQISQALKKFPVRVKTIYANEITGAQFRAILLKTIKNSGSYIIINFSRAALGEEGGGHMSPLAAYDEKTDRVLILDVSRYRYPSIWVTTQDLWRSISTIDKNSGTFRGLIILSREREE